MLDNQNEILTMCRNIHTLRITHHLTQKQMAEICGISVPTLHKLEQNILPHNLGVQLLFRINRYFGVMPGRMFGELLQAEKES